MAKVVLFTFFLSVIPHSVFAHAFGQQFTLPLPVDFYITGGVVALLFSFIIFVIFGRSGISSSELGERKNIRITHWRQLTQLLQGVSLTVFFTVLVVGIFGTSDSAINPVPTLFWIILLLGFSYLTIFIDGIWEIVNPFRLVTDLIASRNVPDRNVRLADYGYWFALLVFIFLVWVELNSGGIGGQPQYLVLGMIGYVVLNAAGVISFGSRLWYERMDFFSVFFRFIGKCAPFEIKDGELVYSRPLYRLISAPLYSMGALCFLLFMLSATAFDGFKETGIWVRALYSITEYLPASFAFLNTLALILSPLLFFVMYAIAVYFSRAISGSVQSINTLVLRFAPSLIPVAVAYHIAHYFSLLYSQGGGLLFSLVHPLDYAANIFGEYALLTVTLPILQADTIWYGQLVVIVLGHIIATYIAHMIAVETFKEKRAALFSQIPLLLLMLIYTSFGLWLLSLPFAPIS